ncbi:MAG: hypothetical protein JST00_36195 [Deltaproteobacteria bacterium]|nr:hypothetical protein [Deltaproteobacteria bacterium]
MAAHAGGPLGPNGAPIQTSDYGIDLFQGPVLASSRVTALGGAYSALAEGAEGIPFNAAAASVRYPYSTTRVDYDLTAGITFPSAVSNTDFDNNGKTGFGYSGFLFLTGGGLLQLGRLGIGTVLSVQNYSLDTPVDQVVRTSIAGAAIRVFKIDAVASYAFYDEQLHIGGGIRGAFITASTGNVPIFGETLLFGSYGIGGQGGVLWTPHALPMRLGVTVRSPVIGSVSIAPNADTNPAGDKIIGGLYLPVGADLPWELEWGVAAQVGPRPLNLGWKDEDLLVGEEVEAERRIYTETNTREPAYLAARRIIHRRYRAIPRRKLLMSLSMVATGPTKNAVGIESMLTQTVDRSGQYFSYTLRGGAEAEVIPHRLQLRAGGYMEPTRFDSGSSRLHFTSGVEVHVLDWDVFGIFPPDSQWRVTGMIDVSRQYFGWGLGAGLWR